MTAASSGKPRLLFLCHTLPWPLDGGVWIRSYHTYRILCQHFDVTALFFERIGTTRARDSRPVDEALEVLRRHGRAEAFPVPQTGNRMAFVSTHLRSVLSRTVYTHYQFDSPAFRARLRELVATGDFDLAHVDSLDLSTYLDELKGIPVALAHHNVESLLLRRRSETEPSSNLRRRYYRLQADLMEKAEKTWGPKVALNVLVSEFDRIEFQRLVPGATATTVPNGVDIDEFRPEPETPDVEGIAHIGGTHWFPNLDALIFFAEQIFPHIRKAAPDATATWVGSASEEEKRRFRDDHGVTLTGYVDDVRPWMRNAACHVVPLRSGGGTRLKILNSWAIGKPVVSTSVGCEGLDAVDGENILIRDEPEAFAAAVLEVLRSPDLRAKLGAGGRRTVESTYAWDVIGEGMMADYEPLLGEARTGATRG